MVPPSGPSAASLPASPPRETLATGGIRGHWWIALLALSIAARAVAAWNDPVLPRDGVLFLGLARSVSEGDFSPLLRNPQHPLYPIAAALIHPLAGAWDLAGVAVSVLAGGLTVVPVILVARRVAGPFAALLAGWVFAASRYPVATGAEAIADALEGLLFAWAAHAGARALRLGETAGGKSDAALGPAGAFSPPASSRAPRSWLARRG